MKKSTITCLATKFLFALVIIFVVASSSSGQPGRNVLLISTQIANQNEEQIATQISDVIKKGNLHIAIALFNETQKQERLTTKIISSYMLAISNMIREEKIKIQDRHFLMEEASRVFEIARNNSLLNTNIISYYISTISNIGEIRNALITARKEGLLSAMVFASYIVAETNLTSDFSKIQGAFELALEKGLLDARVIEKYLRAAERAKKFKEVQIGCEIAKKMNLLNNQIIKYCGYSPITGHVNTEGQHEDVNEGEISYLESQDDNGTVNEGIESDKFGEGESGEDAPPRPAKEETTHLAKGVKTWKSHPPIDPTGITDLHRTEQAAREAVVDSSRYKASKKFFDPKKHHVVVDKLMEDFEKQYNDGKDKQELNITGLTSRMRINLINRIVKQKRQRFRQINERFWRKIDHPIQKVLYRDRKPTVFIIGDFKYELVCYITKHQPGGGVISIVINDREELKGIGNIKAYEQIIEWLKELKLKNGNLQKYISLLLLQKKYGDPINTGLPKMSCILNYLNLLLDYEEARRRVEGDVWGTLPIAIHFDRLVRELESWSFDTDHGKDMLSLFMSVEFRHSAEQKLASANRIDMKTEAGIREDLENLHGADEYSDNEYAGDLEDKDSKRLKRVKREKDRFFASIVDRYIQGIRSTDQHRLLRGGDLELEIIAELRKRRVVIYYQATKEMDREILRRELGPRDATQTIDLWFDGEYYQVIHTPITNPKDVSKLTLEEVSKDEDNLYHAVLTALDRKSTPDAIKSLRNQVADELDKNPKKLKDIVEKITIDKDDALKVGAGLPSGYLSEELKKLGKISLQIDLSSSASSIDYTKLTIQGFSGELAYLSKNLDQIITGEKKEDLQKEINEKITSVEEAIKEIVTENDLLEIERVINDIVLWCWSSKPFEIKEIAEEIDDIGLSDSEGEKEHLVHNKKLPNPSEKQRRSISMPGEAPKLSEFQKKIMMLRNDIKVRIDKEYASKPQAAKPKSEKITGLHETKDDSKKTKVGHWFDLDDYHPSIKNDDKTHKDPRENKEASDYWYWDEDMLLLLSRHLPEDQGFIVTPPAATIFEDKALLNNTIKMAMQAALNGSIVVMPVHLHGNHWVGAMFRQQADHSIQVIYINPQGEIIDKEPNAMMFVETIQNIANTITTRDANIIDLNLRQQRNGYDCGPFTVDNLVRLARHAAEFDHLNRNAIIERAALQHSQDGNATAIRRLHLLILLPDQPQDDGIEQITRGMSYSLSSTTTSSSGTSTSASASAVSKQTAILAENKKDSEIAEQKSAIASLIEKEVEKQKKLICNISPTKSKKTGKFRRETFAKVFENEKLELSKLASELESSPSSSTSCSIRKSINDFTKCLEQAVNCTSPNRVKSGKADEIDSALKKAETIVEAIKKGRAWMQQDLNHTGRAGLLFNTTQQENGVGPITKVMSKLSLDSTTASSSTSTSATVSATSSGPTMTSTTQPPTVVIPINNNTINVGLPMPFIAPQILMSLRAAPQAQPPGTTNNTQVPGQNGINSLAFSSSDGSSL